MRWYCVSPSLPRGAQLRVREAPSAGAPETSAVRLCISDVIAVANAPAPGVPWLQVRWQQLDGFVMSMTPDNMPLMVPWESTALEEVVFAYPETQLVHVQTNEIVELELDVYLGVLGAVEERLLVMYQGEQYFVHTSDTVPMAQRLNSRDTFMMNPTLPENATIVIREWPSRDSNQVDVITHNQEVEGLIRSEDWIKINEQAWVMWKLTHHNNLQLLQSTKFVLEQIRELMAAEESNENQMTATTEEEPPAVQITSNNAQSESSDQDNRPQINEDETRATSSEADDRNIKPAQEYIEDERPIQLSTANTMWDERPIKPAQTLEDERPIQPSQQIAANSWEDRPIKPTPSYSEDERPIQPKAPSTLDDRPINPADKIVNDNALASERTQESLNHERPIKPAQIYKEDDRPIQPAQLSSWDERPIQPAPSSSWDDRPIKPAQSYPEDESPIQPPPSSSWDDRPIKSAPSSSWDDRPIKPAQSYPDDERPIQPAQSSWDDRPIKPAQSVMDEEPNEGNTSCAEHPIQAAQSSSWEDRPIKPAHTDVNERLSDDVPSSTSWNDRPIQSDQSFVAEQTMETVPTTLCDDSHVDSLEELPIEPAKRSVNEQPISLTNAWDEVPIKPARSPDKESLNPEISTGESNDTPESLVYERLIKTEEQEIAPGRERRSSSACSEWEPIVQRRRSSLEEDVVIRTDEVVSFESDDTDEESLPKFATRYDEMIAELSDFNIMWLLQLDLLEELYHHLELKSISLSEMKRLMEMMEIKASHAIHAKVIGSFLRLMPFITTYYKSEGALLTPHMEHLLPPFMSLFQERSKAAISTLEKHLKSWFSVLDVVLILNSLETAIVDLEMTELGIARLVTWFAQEMPMTNGVTKASSRLCDALVQLTSHRATKVRNASTDILANILGHNESGEVPSWLANGTPQCLAARVNEKFPSHPLVSQLESMQDIVIPPQQEQPTESPEAPVEPPKESKPSKLKPRQITKPWLKKKEAANDTEEQPAKPWLKKKEAANDSEEQPAKPWLKKKEAVNVSEEQPAKPWLKKTETVGDSVEEPAKPWLKKTRAVNDTDEQPAKPWLTKTEAVNDSEDQTANPRVNQKVPSVVEEIEATESELKPWQKVCTKKNGCVSLDEKTSDSMGIPRDSLMEADVTTSSSLLPAVDEENSQCDNSSVDNDTNNQVCLNSTSVETDESASYSEDENVIVILDDEGLISTEEMDASEMHFGSDVLDKTHDKNTVIFAVEKVDAVPEKTSRWLEPLSEQGMKEPDHVKEMEQLGDDPSGKTPSTSGDDEQPLLSSTLVLEDDHSFYEAGLVGNVAALPMDVENVGDKEKMLVDIEAMLQAFKEEESGEEDLGGKQSWFFVDEHTDDDEDYPDPAMLGESDNEDSGWEETSRASLPLLGNTVYDILENHPLEFFSLDKPHEDKAALEQILHEHHGFDEMLPPDMTMFMDTPHNKSFERVLNSINEVTTKAEATKSSGIISDDTKSIDIVAADAKSNEIIETSHTDIDDFRVIPTSNFNEQVAHFEQDIKPTELNISTKEDYVEKDMVPDVDNKAIDKEIRKSLKEAFDEATVGTDEDEISSHQGYFRGRFASDFDEFFPEDEVCSERVDDGWSRVPSSIHSRRNSDVSNYGMDFHKHDFPATEIVVPEEDEEEEEPFIPENIDRYGFFDGFEDSYPSSLEPTEAMEVLYIPLGWWIQECHDILVTSEHDEQASLAELDSAFCMLEVTFPTVEGDEDTLFYEESTDNDVAMTEQEWASICAYQENWRRAKNSLVVDFQSAIAMILDYDAQRKDDEAAWASANSHVPEQRSKSLTLRRNSIYGSLTPAVKRHSESSIHKASAHLTPTPSALVIPPRIRTSAASPHLARSSSSRASSEASDSPRGSITAPCHFQRANSETSNSPRTSFSSEPASKPSLTLPSRLGRYSPDPTESPRQSITMPSRLSRAPSDGSISSRSSRLESPRKSLAMPSSRLARSPSESLESPRKSLTIPTSRLSRAASESMESPRKSFSSRLSRPPSESLESPRKSLIAPTSRISRAASESVDSPRRSLTLPASRLSRAPSDAIESPRKSLSMQNRPARTSSEAPTRHSISAIPSGLKKPVTASTRSLLHPPSTPTRARSTSSAPSGLRPPTTGLRVPLSRLKKM